MDHHRRLASLAAGWSSHRGLWVAVLLGLAAPGTFLAAVPVVELVRPVSPVLFARDGALLAARTAEDQQWRFPPRATVPAKVAAAVIAFEDRRFDWHLGVDPLAVLRAAGQNLAAGEVRSGASTLTMQVVRLSRPGRPRTVAEKVIESILALRLELSASKEEILARYLSFAPMGGNVVGLDAAAWRYFGVRPETLSWGEAATLAVLPNSPALVHPGRSRERLRRRRDLLLDRLAAAGTIDATTGALAKTEPIPTAPHEMPQLAPHLLARFGGSRGAPMTTTIDIDLQRRVGELVARHNLALAANEIHNAAAMVVAVESGEVLAYVGNATGADGRPADHAADVDVGRAPRSTGSILKPLLYAAAFDAGELLPTELVEDTPLRVGGFAPENFSRTFAGAVPAALALARSLNVPAARLLQEYGVDRFHGLLGRAGMTTLNRPADHYGLSLILGGAEGTLWEITGIYASMARTVSRAARHQETHASFFAPRVTLASPADGRAPPFGPGAAFVTLQAMLEVERPGAEASWRDFAAPRQVAWKTGTSFGFRDGWAVGVTPRHAVGVWIGNADGEGRPGLTGVGAAAPLMFDIFAALPPAPWFAAPSDDLVPVTLCRHSGQRAGPDCADTEIIDAPRAALSGRVCAYCRTVALDADERFRVHDGCAPLTSVHLVRRFALPTHIEWFYRMRHADYAPLPPWREDCRATLPESDGALSILYPRSEGALYVPVELDGQRGRTVFEAAHRDVGATLFWHLDDEYVGATRSIHQLAVAPAPGPHTLTVLDERGERASRRFVVLQK